MVVGILLALQINNWSEKSKEKSRELKLYNNLLLSLQSDSVKLREIIDLHQQSIAAQEIVINQSVDELTAVYNHEELQNIASDIIHIGTSFFPRYGFYNQITSQGQMRIIRSEEIQSRLIELYDQRYKRHDHIDQTIERMVQFNVKSIIYGDMQIAAEKTDNQVEFEIERFIPFLL